METFGGLLDRCVQTVRGWFAHLLCYSSFIGAKYFCFFRSKISHGGVPLLEVHLIVFDLRLHLRFRIRLFDVLLIHILSCRVRAVSHGATKDVCLSTSGNSQRVPTFLNLCCPVYLEIRLLFEITTLKAFI